MTELIITKNTNGEVRWEYIDCGNDVPKGTNVTRRQGNILKWLAAVYSELGLDLPLGERMAILNPRSKSNDENVVRAGVSIWRKYQDESGNLIDQPTHMTAQEVVVDLLEAGVRIGKYANYSPSE